MNIVLSLILIFVSQTLTAKTFKTEQWQTSTGTKVVFYQAMEVPMLEIILAFAAGSAYDGETFGISALTNHLINQGSEGMDANALAEALADTGAQYDANSSRDIAALHLKSLTKADALSKATSIFAHMITKANFPMDAFEREKKQQLMTIKQIQESPEDVANVTFFKALYQNHPYAHSINGTAETVHPLTVEQITAFYKQYYVASNATLIVVGAIESKQAHDLAEKLTHNLPKGQPAQAIAKASALTTNSNISVTFPSSQTMVRLGQMGIDHHSQDYFPLTVGNYILGGGGLISQLATEVREKRGLTYGISSQFIPLSGDGPFIINFSTKGDQAQDALGITRFILADFVKKGPTDKELVAAKQFLSGSFPISLGSNRNIANILLKMAFYNLPNDYLDRYVANIQAVTREQIKQAFQDHLQLDKLLTVLVGPT